MTKYQPEIVQNIKKIREKSKSTLMEAKAAWDRFQDVDIAVEFIKTKEVDPLRSKLSIEADTALKQGQFELAARLYRALYTTLLWDQEWT